MQECQRQKHRGPGGRSSLNLGEAGGIKQDGWSHLTSWPNSHDSSPFPLFLHLSHTVIPWKLCHQWEYEGLWPGGKLLGPHSHGVCALSLSRVRLCATPWAVACRPLCPWDSPGKSTGVGCHSLLQGIFLTQVLNLGCLRCLPWWAVSLPFAPPGKRMWKLAWLAPPGGVPCPAWVAALYPLCLGMGWSGWLTNCLCAFFFLLAPGAW